jgi:hypothetical protein
MKQIKNIQFIILLIGAIVIIGSSCEDYTEDFSPAPASLAPHYSYSPEKFITPSREVVFTNTSVVPVKNGEVTFHWDFGDGNEKTIEDAEIKNQTELVREYYNQVTHAFSDTGLYTVTLEVVTSEDTAVLEKELLVEYALIGDTLLYETFDESIPENWVLRNLDGATPALEGDAVFADSAWVAQYSDAFESNVAVAVSYYDPETSANDWMITNKVSLGDSTAMRWDAMSFTSSGDYPDTYGIYVSTTDQTVEGCKANGILMKVQDESWSADIPGGKGIMSRRFRFYEHGFKNQDVYVAFRLMTPDPGGSSLGIDDIAIVDLTE